MHRFVWFVILTQFVWLNFIVPGHVRGQMTLPGGEPSCCAGKQTGKTQPTPADQQRCAICNVAAGYTLPPIFVIALQPTGRTFEARPVEVQALVSLHLQLTYDANGPPVVL